MRIAIVVPLTVLCVPALSAATPLGLGTRMPAITLTDPEPHLLRRAGGCDASDLGYTLIDNLNMCTPYTGGYIGSDGGCVSTSHIDAITAMLNAQYGR